MIFHCSIDVRCSVVEAWNPNTPSSPLKSYGPQKEAKGSLSFKMKIRVPKGKRHFRSYLEPYPRWVCDLQWERFQKQVGNWRVLVVQQLILGCLPIPFWVYPCHTMQSWFFVTNLWDKFGRLKTLLDDCIVRRFASPPPGSTIHHMVDAFYSLPPSI